MAKMFPERLPQSVIDDPFRNAELKVFKALQALPDAYRVFYSMHWQKRDDYWGVSEGEADFIIVHPDMGMIVMEVKGGAIRYDATQEQWYTQNRLNEVFEIKDPVEQGRRNHYAIRDKLDRLPGWPQRALNIWHVVCFPDVHLKPGQYFRPDMERELVVEADDLDDISATMKRIFSHCFGTNMAAGAPGRDRLQIIENLLAHSFTIQSPLGVDLEREDQKLIELTEQQFRALALLGDRKRAAIAGCAGSGKTMLAAQKAQQFADLGMSVLLVCFNVALSEDLARRMPDVEVHNFHGLCRQAARDAGIFIKNTASESELFNEILPSALMEAADSIGRIYDAVIVDEGQDFEDNYWIGLEALLKEDGYLYIFFDNNQNLFSRSGTFGGMITEPPFILYQNCRNTKAIHEVVASFHNNPASLQCYSPDGRQPEIIHYDGDEAMLRELQKLLHRLVIDENIDCEDIVILTPRGEKATRLTPGLKLGNFTLSSQKPGRINQVQATSVYKFKGLEQRVVILAEVDQRHNYNRDMVMYVGCSRARTHLVILSDEKAPHQLKERLNAEP